MQGWQPEAARRVTAGRWASACWINPSPNAANLWMARAYAGTVMLEGTTLSEGRGTTRPLELFGAPDIEPRALLAKMESLAPHWMHGCRLRDCRFEPTFHKHAGTLCAGLQIHVEDAAYDHDAFRPWRLLALVFKALRTLHPDYELVARLCLRIRVRASGHRRHQRRRTAAALGRRPRRRCGDLDALAAPDEQAWREERESVLLYR